MSTNQSKNTHYNSALSTACLLLVTRNPSPISRREQADGASLCFPSPPPSGPLQPLICGETWACGWWLAACHTLPHVSPPHPLNTGRDACNTPQHTPAANLKKYNVSQGHLIPPTLSSFPTQPTPLPTLLTSATEQNKGCTQTGSSSAGSAKARCSAESALATRPALRPAPLQLRRLTRRCHAPSSPPMGACTFSGIREPNSKRESHMT